MDHYYKQPKYFREFKCIGGNCPLTCCSGWEIDWFPFEYDKLVKAEMSKELRIGVDNNFSKLQSGLYSIRLRENGRCPFQEEESCLCSIQKELGPEYLGTTCSRYPRRFFKRNNVVFRSCMTSCAAVISLLINDKRACQLEFTPARDINSIESAAMFFDKKDDVARSLYLKYRLDILDFYVEAFNCNDSIENLIVLGALAAKKISDCSMVNKDSEISNIIDNYKKQFNSAAILKSVDEIKPNYSIKYVIINNLAVKYLEAFDDVIKIISLLHDGEKLIPERYNEGKEKFEAAFAGKEWVLKNILINLFIDIFVHLHFTEGSFWNFYSYYTACAALIQTVAYAVGYAAENIDLVFVKSCAFVCRSISHNHSRANDIVEYIKTTGLKTPAHLALIIK